MVDIFTFWHSLKCSWVRRLLSTDAFWPQILSKELSKNGTNTNELLFSGPSKLTTMSKLLKNKFWKNVLDSLAILQREAAFSTPENWLLFSIFDNPLIKSGRRCLSSRIYTNSGQIKQVADLFISENTWHTLQDLNEKYSSTLSTQQFERIKNAILSGLRILNANLGNCNWHPEPRQSIVIQIASRNKRGCRAFHNTFRSRQNLRGNTSKFEEKWHSRLNTNLSVQFWDSAWKLQASIKENNVAKWLQCQLLRGSLFTNNRVSKFKRSVSESCDLCQAIPGNPETHPENPYSLFWTCPQSQLFWADLKLYFLDFTINLPLSRTAILFGVLDETYDSTPNQIILLGKRVIWACKHKKTVPTKTIFLRSLKNHLNVLKVICVIRNTSTSFDGQWGRILAHLSGQQEAVQDGQLQGHDDQLHGQP